MCGFVGSWPADSAWAAQALKKIAHRGPDGAGYAERWGATHAHCRLSLLDPSPRSDQPFRYGGVTLSFAGEVWNYRALRNQLIAEEACVFATESDTEVVAAALDRWGDRALERLEGMFAVAWTDGGGATYLARDRFGKVPLYLLETEESLLGPSGCRWASERKAFGEDALLADPVQPGTVMPVNTNDRYDWARPFYDLEEAVLTNRRPLLNDKGVLAALRRSVKARMWADAPVACLLSGGLDSALILALAREVRPDVQAYAAVWDPESEDVRTARRLCAELDVPLTEVRVPHVGDVELREAVRTIELTTKTSVEIACLAIPLARRLSRDGFKAVLSGEGADELFGGYGTLARRATSDLRWTEERIAFVAKMGRSDLVRVNKAFMSAGVECRTPFLERELVEDVLGLDIPGCRPGKKLLKAAVRPVLPDYVIDRKKVTFQGGAGLAEHLERHTGGQQVKAYNEIAREVFGGIPRG